MISLSIWILLYIMIGGVVLYYSNYQPFPEIGGKYGWLLISFGVVFWISSTAPRETMEEIPALISTFLGGLGVIFGVRHMVITKHDVILAPFSGVLFCIGSIDLLTKNWISATSTEQIISFIIASLVIILEIYLAFRGLVVGIPGISWSKSGLRQINRGLIYGDNGAIAHFEKSWDMNDPWLNAMSHAVLILIYDKIGNKAEKERHLIELEKGGGWNAVDTSWTDAIKKSLTDISL